MHPHQLLRGAQMIHRGHPNKEIFEEHINHYMVSTVAILIETWYRLREIKVVRTINKGKK